MAGLPGRAGRAGRARSRPRIRRELYGVRESVEHIDISPDGNHVVYLQPGRGRTPSSSSTISRGGGDAARGRTIGRQSGTAELVQFRHQRAADLPGHPDDNRGIADSLLAADLDRHRRRQPPSCSASAPRSTTRGCASSTARSSIGWRRRRRGADGARYVPEAGRIGSRWSRTRRRPRRSTGSTSARCGRPASSRRTGAPAAISATGAAMSGSWSRRRSVAAPARSAAESTIFTGPQGSARLAAARQLRHGAGRGHASARGRCRRSMPLMC